VVIADGSKYVFLTIDYIRSQYITVRNRRCRFISIAFDPGTRTMVQDDRSRRQQYRRNIDVQGAIPSGRSDTFRFYLPAPQPPSPSPPPAPARAPTPTPPTPPPPCHIPYSGPHFPSLLSPSFPLRMLYFSRISPTTSVHHPT
jgi:hypothetical protein